MTIVGLTSFCIYQLILARKMAATTSVSLEEIRDWIAKFGIWTLERADKKAVCTVH